MGRKTLLSSVQFWTRPKPTQSTDGSDQCLSVCDSTGDHGASVAADNRCEKSSESVHGADTGPSRDYRRTHGSPAKEQEALHEVRESHERRETIELHGLV